MGLWTTMIHLQLSKVYKIQSNTWTDIPNDGLGVDTNKAYKPQHVTELLDVTTGYLDFSELNIGDAVVIRNDFIIRPQSNNVKAEFRYVVANSTTYYLHKTFPRLDSGSGVDYEINLSTDYIYIGNEQTRDAAIQMQNKIKFKRTIIQYWNGYTSNSKIKIKWQKKK